MRSFLEGTWNAPKTHLYQGASTIGVDREVVSRVYFQHRERNRPVFQVARK